MTVFDANSLYATVMVVCSALMHDRLLHSLRVRLYKTAIIRTMLTRAYSS